MDDVLAGYGWKRARLDDVGGELNKLAARLVCRAYSPTSGAMPVMAMVDVNLWRSRDKVHAELTVPVAPRILSTLVAQGRQGVTPHGVGLVPCGHQPWHWNPFCLPLVWQAEMDSLARFNAFVLRYMSAFRDLSWQCPDAVRLIG